MRRPKEELFLDSLLICNNLLRPLDSVLRISKTVYNNYRANGFLYNDAKRLNNLNLEMLKLLDENKAIFPSNLREDFDIFIDYLERWTNAFSDLNSKKQYNADDYFRVIYSGSTFPTSSTILFEAELKNRCN